MTAGALSQNNARRTDAKDASTWRRAVLIGSVYSVSYLALDLTSSIHAWSALEFTLWNPQPALMLALFIVYGAAYAPLAFAVALLAEYVRSSSGDLAVVVLGSTAISVIGYGVLGVGLRWASRFDLWRGEFKELLLLLFPTAAGALAVSVSTVSLHLFVGSVGVPDFLSRVGEFWIGDATGILALLPVLLLLHADSVRWRRQFRTSLLDQSIFLVGLFVAGWVVFVADFADEFHFFYLLFLPVIWLAIQRGIFGGTLGVLLTQIGVVLAVLVREYPTDAFLAFQMLMLILAVTGMFMGGAVSAWSRAQQQVQRQQVEMDRVARVMAIGTMGSALAHEISQPLASISTYARACQLLLGKGEAAQARLTESLDKIVDETERAGAVLRNLRDSIADGRTHQETVDLAALLRRVIELVRREPSSANVTIAPMIARLPHVRGYRVHIEQIVLNILRNAAEATAHATPGGAVALTADGRDRFVEVAIDDQGAGIEEDIAERLFEPFLTTKPQGLGLGLVISRNLLELAGGEIAFENLAKGGARFTIRIPIEGRAIHG